MKKEYWKPVLGYEGLYEVSNWGRVKSLRLGKEQILKPFKTGKGYLQVGLWKNKHRKNYSIHQLVALHFIPNPYNLNEVNHKDENPQNNFVENLEWCTHSYNINYGTRTEKCSKKCSKPILQYTLDGEFVKEWESAIQAEREGGFKSRNITACCKGKRKSQGGFIWRYK